MKVHIKDAWNVLFNGLPTISGLVKMNEDHWRRINELETQEGLARTTVRDMVKEECLKNEHILKP